MAKLKDLLNENIGGVITRNPFENLDMNTNSRNKSIRIARNLKKHEYKFKKKYQNRKKSQE